MVSMNPLLKPPRPRAASGFTLAELMVTIAVIGIVFGITTTTIGSEWSRGRVNLVSQDLASWLEGVRSASTRQSGSTPCIVTFNTTSPLAAGAEMARVSPAACAPTSPVSATVNTARAIVVPNIIGNNTFAIALNPSSPTTVTFTPRGSVSATADTDYRINFNNQQRCVQLTATLGLLRIGSGSVAPGNACTTFNAF